MASIPDNSPSSDADRRSLNIVRQTVRQLNRVGLLLTGGNLSCRSSVNEYLITPTGYVVDQMAVPEALELVKVRIDEDSPKIASSETPIHSALYTRFPEVGGVCHVHSPSLLALGEPELWPRLTTSIEKCLPVHTVVGNGVELAANAASLLTGSDSSLLSRYGIAIISPGHGVFTAARTLQRAVHLMLRIDENASVALLSSNRRLN